MGTKRKVHHNNNNNKEKDRNHKIVIEEVEEAEKVTNRDSTLSRNQVLSLMIRRGRKRTLKEEEREK